tara:strand:- start:3131 stop:3727 length:597 start_codon:yes stop_codon:yes gene_type:complete
MYITNNKITTNVSSSSAIDLLNTIKDELFQNNDDAINFQELLSVKYVHPRIYVMDSDNASMNFIEFFNEKPADDEISSMKSLVSYRTEEPAWTSVVTNVTISSELMTRIEKILSHFTTFLGDNVDNTPMNYDAKTTVGDSLQNITLTDIDSETPNSSWSLKEKNDLGIFLIQASGNIPYDLIRDDLMNELDSYSSNII